MRLMNLALLKAKQMLADWIIYLDADEFIILNKFNNVQELLSHNIHADSLAINWLLFGTNNLIEDPPINTLILENYTKSELHLNKHVKTFIRPNKAIHASNPHFYNMQDQYKMYSFDGQLNNNIEPFYFHSQQTKYYDAPAYIAHYIYQNEHRYLARKVKLPRDDTGTYREQNLNLHNEFNDHTNMQPKNKYANAVKQYIQLNKSTNGV